MSNFNDNEGMLNGFRSKYSTLPKISDLSNTDLIPYHEKNGGVSSPDAIERINSLETRLSITEKSNRALLEEVVRLHNEFRTTSKQYDDAFKEERKMRSFIENNWKNGQSQIKEMESRLRSTEELLNEERYQLRELLNQSKSVEDLMYSSKKDVSIFNDRQISKLLHVEREMEILNDNRNKMERISFQLVDEMKTIKTKLESQGFDFNAVTHELRNNSKKLEVEYQQNIDVVKKQLSKSDNSLSDSLYRPMIEQKLMELKDYVTQIRDWHDDEINERRILEKTIMAKFAEITHSMNEQARNREEALRQIQYLQRERDHKADTERMTMQNKMAEITEQINSKVLEKDLRLREDQLKRQAELEKLLRSEQEIRITYEREIRLENERRLDSIRYLQTEELNSIKESLKQEKSKYVESIKRLDEALSLLERQIDTNKFEVTKIVSAEVKARCNNEKAFKERFKELEDKISEATSMFQIALNGVAERSLPNIEKVSNGSNMIRKTANDVLDEYKSSTNRQIADLDARIINLQLHGTALSSEMDEQIKQAIASGNLQLKEKIETMILEQGSTNANITQLKVQKQQLKQEVYELNELVTLTKSESNARMHAEMTSRIETEEHLRYELDKLKECIPKEIVSKSDLDKVKATARKLAESMQTIKTVLGMKIQSEQNLRIEEIKNHQEELIQLKSLIEPFVQGMRTSGRGDDEIDNILKDPDMKPDANHPWEEGDKNTSDDKENQNNKTKDNGEDADKKSNKNNKSATNSPKKSGQ